MNKIGPPILGKRLKPGAVFESPSKKMDRNGYYYNGYSGDKPVKLKVRRKGDRDWFIKGKRRYFCEVKGISETRTGVHCWKDLANDGTHGPRWWKFTYVVQVLKN